jgi:hypothetical protein
MTRQDWKCQPSRGLEIWCKPSVIVPNNAFSGASDKSTGTINILHKAKACIPLSTLSEASKSSPNSGLKERRVEYRQIPEQASRQLAHTASQVFRRWRNILVGTMKRIAHAFSSNVRMRGCYSKTIKIQCAGRFERQFPSRTLAVSRQRAVARVDSSPWQY